MTAKNALVRQQTVFPARLARTNVKTVTSATAAKKAANHVPEDVANVLTVTSALVKRL